MSQAWRQKVRGVGTQESLREAQRALSNASFFGKPMPDDLEWETYVPWDPMPWVFGFFFLWVLCLALMVTISAFASL